MKKAHKADLAQSVSRVEEILRHWDPIGIHPGGAALDEYDTYAPSIVSLVSKGGSLEQLAGYLEIIRRAEIGASPDPEWDRQIDNRDN